MSTSTPIPVKVSLQASSASVKEGAVAKLTVIGDPSAQIPYFIVGLNPEDLTAGAVNGRVILDDLGIGTISLGIAADAETEGTETLIVNAGNSFAIMSVEDTSKAETTYFIEAIDGMVEEGKVASFLISAKNAVPGTKLPYTLSGKGFDLKDVSNGKLSGSVALGVDSTAIITVPIKADATTEGDEELTLTLTGRDAVSTITIDDSSTEAAVAATYTVWAAEAAVEEGGDAEFLIETSPTQAGKSLKWTITGVSTSDVVGKKLSGSVVIDQDGTAAIVIPTATDGLKEGTETLTLTLNNQKASVALLDNQAIRIASVVLGSDSEGTWGIYRLEDGSPAIAEAGLVVGDELGEYLPLRASPSKAYALPKVVSKLISYEDGGFGLLSKSGTSYGEQKFSDAGIAKGGALKLSAAQLLEKESQTGVDLNGDGIAGEVVATVLDGDGDPTQEEYGLYRASSGALAVSQSGLEAGDALIDPLILQASRGKPLSLKASQVVLGLGQTAVGDWEVLTRSGKALSTQVFDAQTGLAKGKTTTVKPGDIRSKETQYGLDLDGDGEVGGDTPIGNGGNTLISGTEPFKFIVQTAGQKELNANDVTSLYSEQGFYQSIYLGATGQAGTVLNIDYESKTSGLKNPLVIGAVSTDPSDPRVGEADRVLSEFLDGLFGLQVGSNSNKKGAANINGAEIYFIGGQLSSFAIEFLKLGPEFRDWVVGGIECGAGTGSEATLKITNSKLYFKRNKDPLNLADTNFDDLNARFLIGWFDGNGICEIKNSFLEFTGESNEIHVGDNGGKGRLTLNNTKISGDASYVPDKSYAEDYSPYSYIFVGVNNLSTGNLSLTNKSSIDLTAGVVSLVVGANGGKASAEVNDSDISLTADGNFSESYGFINVGGWDGGDQKFSSGKLKIINNSSVSTSAIASGISVGRNGSAEVYLESSNLSFTGLRCGVEVGSFVGLGNFTSRGAKTELIAKRSAEHLVADKNEISWEDYSTYWSGAYLIIGVDRDDQSAATNGISEGVVNVADQSLLLVRGPHAGIQVGGSSSKSTGELNIDASVVEVAGSGAIKLPGKTGTSDKDYLSAGINNNGDLNLGYFTFMNVGGSNWQDFGGVGSVTVSNGSELKIYQFDITSGDTVLEANQASVNIGTWGTKGSLVIDGNSRVSVAGWFKLGLDKDMSGTNFDTDAGLANVSNYSMANIASGRLDVYSYNSSVANQGLKSPLTNYAMYTVLGSQGTLTANQFGFYKNSQIIGSGRIVLDDVFSNSTVSVHSDTETSKTHVVKDAGSDGFMMIDETELLIGDSFNFDNLARRPGFGTLTMKDETGSEYSGSLTVEDSTLVFDISKGQSDKLVVEGFDYCSMNRNNFVVSGTGLQRGERYVLIDFKLNPEGFSGDLEQLLNVKLIGVKGELSYDAAAMDVVFTVG